MLLHTKFKIILLIFFSILHFNVKAQELNQSSNLTEQIWSSYKMTYRLNNTTNISSDFGFRTISPKYWNRYYVNPGINITLPKIMFKKLQYKESLSGGLAFFYTDNKDISDRLEIRPYQGYTLDWPNWKRLRLRHYVKLEERFELNTNNWNNNFGMRFRYLLDLNLKLQGDLLAEAKGIYFPMSIEFFWNLIGVKQFNDVVRTSAGVGAVFNRKWKAEARVGYHYSRDTITEDFSTNDIIYQAKLFFTIN
ncbi:DUF2490 domain-containing protein [Flammeovirga pacifica]|uniref:DUF2490 domain-containing protein n=1 Tax=Flammeovirga pacifica TaxID=915059 RepID=A0A1S1Z1L9_FLAPC|nr:DUF2490 domain-containing protein [Flammeovirga pacifica]OHX67166.1 hypothetical protein NH26_12870 [Flammeovirga pacifica]